jgi:hypothetical protein
LPPYGYLGKIDRIDPQVGGGYHMSVRPVVDLPQPLSPTRPRVSPL